LSLAGATSSPGAAYLVGCVVRGPRPGGRLREWRLVSCPTASALRRVNAGFKSDVAGQRHAPHMHQRRGDLLRACSAAKELRRDKVLTGKALLPADTMGHDDVGKGLAEGRHDAVDEPAATGRRLKGSRRRGYRSPREGAV
jgi:hypothetical protein